MCCGDGGVCQLVDFEDCGLSDVEALLTEVSLTAAQQARCAAYRKLFATSWLVMLLPGNPGFRRNPVGSTEDQALHVLDLLDG